MDDDLPGLLSFEREEIQVQEHQAEAPRGRMDDHLQEKAPQSLFRTPGLQDCPILIRFLILIVTSSKALVSNSKHCYY